MYVKNIYEKISINEKNILIIKSANEKSKSIKNHKIPFIQL